MSDSENYHIVKEDIFMSFLEAVVKEKIALVTSDSKQFKIITKKNLEILGYSKRIQDNNIYYIRNKEFIEFGLNKVNKDLTSISERLKNLFK